MPADHLTDADLDRLYDQVTHPSDTGLLPPHPREVRALVALAREALRARRAQDTPSDPTAWSAGNGAVLTDGTRVELLYRQGAPGMWWVQRPDGHAAVAHELHLRAPGAVAAAATEEDRRHRSLLRSAWVESEDWRSQAERLARLLVRDRVALARVKAQRDKEARPRGLVLPWAYGVRWHTGRHRDQTVTATIDHGEAVALAAEHDGEVVDLYAHPAPSAGEDEAAVERAAEVTVNRDDVSTAVVWAMDARAAAALGDVPCPPLDRLRAAVEAARPDPTQDGDRG